MHTREPDCSKGRCALMPRAWQDQRHFLLGLIEPTGALHEPRLLCPGILHRLILCLGILLGPDLCSGIFHDLCFLHGPDLLLHGADRLWGRLHGL